METITTTENETRRLMIEDLPTEAFQHICAFCSLHELAALRTLSKRVRDLVDDSLTARNTFANPTEEVRNKQKQDPLACFISITLQRKHQPITAVFARYNKEHNYLEFIQRDDAIVDLDADPATLGRLDFNNWEMQLKGPSSSSSSSTALQQRPRRASMTQGGSIRASQTYMEQELENGGPIQPMPTSQPVLSSFFGSTPTPATAPTPAATVRQGFNHMAQYVMSTFASTPSGLTAEQIQQEARRMFHTVDNEVLSSKKQYRFVLTEGTHFIGDDEFIIRYTITNKEPSMETHSPNASEPDNSKPQLNFKIDYIRASWRWISSGAPKSLRSRKPTTTIGGDQGRERQDDREPWKTQLNMLPELRIGKMYASRFNMLLEEIGRQKVSPGVRGQLRDLGYDASLFPKKFIYANLRDEHVLQWITQEHLKESDHDAAALRRTQEQERMTIYDEWEMVESMSTSQQLAQIRAEKIKADREREEKQIKDDREREDKAELQKMVDLLEEEKGYLTARNILEEMLACQGYSRDLIWKYGVVRRNMMGPVPSQTEAKKLLTKVVDSEAAHASSARPYPPQL
ncbi:hypothetical protein BGZ96_009240 [Linnemannia gamsii]|uniref:F-box domain-containing protein n=1 Tax=Linnemannia gamsii TaxID=64522 RepID=A0ABQ7JWY6_9FUNG|nr:hypothetical protein BGZ96_009240 [Linnemannia gamsii]